MIFCRQASEAETLSWLRPEGDMTTEEWPEKFNVPQTKAGEQPLEPSRTRKGQGNGKLPSELPDRDIAQPVV